MRYTTILFLLLAALCLSGNAAAAAAAPPATGTPAASMSDPVLEAGRALTRAFLDGDIDALRSRFNEDMKGAFDAASLATFRQQVIDGSGEEQDVLSEDRVQVHGMESYLRTSRWSQAPGPVLTQWVFAADGRVAGFVVQLADAAPRAAESPHLERDTLADLRLPFGGEWYVVWGGRDIAQNYHAANPGQRFAYDFLRLVDGSTHTGDGSELAHYHCWDQPILAPAGGRVVEAVDGLPDQQIGTTNARQPAGNHVVLDLGAGEYALLAHFRQGSVRVRPGQQVAAGHELGRCGNSGNTSEPHLHFHLQDSPVFGEGDGLPAFFNDYTADGEAIERGEPVQGQRVRRNEDSVR